MVLLNAVLKRSKLRELFRLSTLAYLDIGAALIGLSAHMGSFSMELKWLKILPTFQSFGLILNH